MKKFKSRKKIKFSKPILFVLIISFSYILTNNYLSSSTKLDPEKFIKSLLNNGFNNQLNNNKSSNNTNIINPISLLEHNLSFKTSNKTFEKETVEYIEKVNNNMNNPTIYIYNTHEGEEYKLDYKYEYSIIPNVKYTSYILQEKLENLGIESIVETNSIKEILNQNKWVYRYSYKASRILLERAYQDTPTLEYFIDIHRDSSNYDKTTLEYNNKKYARILFVVGLEHENYEYNLELADKLSERLNNEIPNISRGISKKEGLGVNGIYNQDFNKNCFLIEVGGVDNNLEEVSNTINIFGDILYSYIKDSE